MKHLKVLLTIFSIGLALLAYKITRSCGIYEEEWNYSFFNSESLLDNSKYKPLLFTFDRLYDYEWDTKEFKRDDNLGEWHKFFEKKATRKDIEEIVYRSSVKTLTDFRNSNKLRGKYSKNTLLKYLQEKDCEETLDYLIFAKECEPHVTKEFSPWDEPVYDVPAMKKLIEQGIKEYGKTKDVFIKMRYAYQIIRLAHYAGLNEKAVELYNKYAKPLKTESQIKYWALGHKAGALRRMEKYSEAAYLFSLIFENCKAKRIPSYYSFLIKTDKQWKETLSFCKDNKEKISLYLLRAINPKNNILEEMKEIYKLNPKSEKLNLLLTREINKLEHDLMGFNFKNFLPLHRNYGGMPKKAAVDYLKSLLAFAENCLKEGKIQKTGLWDFAISYMDYMKGDFDKAKEGIAKLKKSSGENKEYAHQLKIFSLVVDLTALEGIDTNVENQYFSQIKKHQKIERFGINIFERLYKKQGEKAKAYLCNHNLDTYIYSPQKDLIDNLIAFKNKDGKTKCEESLSVKAGSKNELLELKATFLFADNKLEEAKKIFESLPKDFLKKYKYASWNTNPFIEKIIDCHECDNGTDNKYSNKLALVKRMLELKKTAESNPTEAAKLYYQLATAYYNISYFGSSWDAIDYHRSGSSIYWGDDENLDCTNAIIFYKKALDASKDAEFQAKCSYMIAKCEQNHFYKSKYFKDRKTRKQALKDYYRTYFKRLKNKYSDTKYYQEIIKECSYFNSFVNQ